MDTDPKDGKETKILYLQVERSNIPKLRYPECSKYGDNPDLDKLSKKERAAALAAFRTRRCVQRKEERIRAQAVAK